MLLLARRLSSDGRAAIRTSVMNIMSNFAGVIVFSELDNDTRYYSTSVKVAAQNSEKSEGSADNFIPSYLS